MLQARTHKSVAPLLFAGVVSLLIAPGVPAAEPVKFSGAITGRVTDSAGVAQMGAAIILSNRQGRQFEKVLTDSQGVFKFLGLLPDLYSVKVTFAAFVPAVRRNIMVQPGMRSVLNVNLNTLFSTIQFAYPPVENGGLMSDDWKWVLRSSSPTRPVLRFTGDSLAKDTTSNSTRSAMFSDTRGILRVSAGDGPLASNVSNEADLGTAFALATSLFGNNLVQVSGNVGYGSQTGVPTAAFRTSYSRSIGPGNPEVSVTMRQLYLPGRLGAAITGTDSALPMVRSMSAGYDDHTQLSDDLNLQYGFTLNSISFLDHLTYASPYARLTYSLGDGGKLEMAYTSGDARPELGQDHQDTELQQSLSTLGMFPRISLRGARPQIQRGENYEIAYSRKVGSRTFLISGYRESVTNAALSIVAPGGMFAGGDILPDLFTGSSIFNAGDYHSTGYTAAVTQNVGEHFAATVMYGSMGLLTAASGEIVSNSPDELRSMIRSSRQQAATARVTATSPWTGTHLIASYQWTADHRAVMPGHLYSTLDVRQMPGLNVYIRQPIPGLGMLPWRIEATADLRNLLAQGYLPLGMPGGQQLILVETPRSFRGGLSFIF
jgi:hypothetical protein